jgi:peptidyl-prolyl cis-trans isomerase SurA
MADQPQPLSKESDFMKTKLALLVGCLLVVSTGAFAQEGEARLIDEVIARVNATPIMRSAFEAAQKDYLEELKRQGLKGEELEKKFNSVKANILDQLIDTQLLAQRAKDLSINVEPQVNEQLVRIMKENNIQSLEDLEQKMREVGVDINEVRRNLGDNFARQAVMYREVYGRIIQALTEKERRDHYEKNKQYFATPGEFTLSHLFIAAGKDAEAAQKKIADILAQARAAEADFAALAKRLSEDAPTAKNGGKIGTLKANELAPEVFTAIEKLNAGEVSEPIKLNNGFSVFRVDEKKDAVTRPFEDQEVQDAVARSLAGERAEKQMDTYLAKLREDAFIEIAPGYQYEDSKVKSAQIKHTPYSEDSGKKKKKEKKDDKKDKKENAVAKENQ